MHGYLAVAGILRCCMRHMSCRCQQHAAVLPHCSDSGFVRLQLPLYPATTVYLQLISESRSRINACDKALDGRVTGVSHSTCGMMCFQLEPA
jgi:hypothetical protein